MHEYIGRSGEELERSLGGLAARGHVYRLAHGLMHQLVHKHVYRCMQRHVYRLVPTRSSGVHRAVMH